MYDLKKWEREMDKEMKKWVDLTYPALALAFTRYWGWGAKRINTVIQATQDAWEECASTNQVSMLQMLEDEVGIEIRNHENGKSWHDLAYFNTEIDAGKMTPQKWIYMRQRQIKWIRQQVLACVLLGLHRKYGFGFERLVRLTDQINAILCSYKFNPRKILEAAQEEANFHMVKGD